MHRRGVGDGWRDAAYVSLLTVRVQMAVQR
jgi:hypothetical protein